MVMPHHRRIWTDANTHLVFGLLVLACGIAILQRASNAENWVVLSETSVDTQITQHVQ
jgi:hypothetical protein